MKERNKNNLAKILTWARIDAIAGLFLSRHEERKLADNIKERYRLRNKQVERKCDEKEDYKRK